MILGRTIGAIRRERRWHGAAAVLLLSACVLLPASATPTDPAPERPAEPPAPTPPPPPPPATPRPRLCSDLRRRPGIVSPGGHEARILRRIDEIVVAQIGKAPETKKVLDVFADCLDVLKERLHEERAAVDSSTVDASVDADARAFADLARLYIVPAEDGSRVLAFVSPPLPEEAPSKSPQELLEEIRSFQVFTGDSIVGAAERITKSTLSSFDRKTRDAGLRNAIWFLWVESYLKALGGRFNYYVYADERLESDAFHMGKAFSVGFLPKFEEDGALRVSEVTDERLAGEGLRADDAVVSLDGRPVAKIERARLQRYWLSPEPFAYEVEVRREATTLRARGTSVPRRFMTMDWALEDGIGYLRLRRFAAQSLVELRRALREIEKAGATGLVIDLRQDGGGVLSPGLVDCFLKPGLTVVTWEDMKPGSKTENLDATVEYHGLPLVVLVDGSTASMGEVFAAAMQVHKRAPLIGQTTFGKGVGQTKYDVEKEGDLLLVDRKYFYPGTHRSWNETGIVPDVVIDVSALEHERITDLLEQPVIDLPRQLADDTALRKAFEALEKKP